MLDRCESIFSTNLKHDQPSQASIYPKNPSCKNETNRTEYIEGFAGFFQNPFHTESKVNRNQHMCLGMSFQFRRSFKRTLCYYCGILMFKTCQSRKIRKMWGFSFSLCGRWRCSRSRRCFDSEECHGEQYESNPDEDKTDSYDS